jgi:hypothetical protein
MVNENKEQTINKIRLRYIFKKTYLKYNKSIFLFNFFMWFFMNKLILIVFYPLGFCQKIAFWNFLTKTQRGKMLLMYYE